jgi:hypothetical protein
MIIGVMGCCLVCCGKYDDDSLYFVALTIVGMGIGIETTRLATTAVTDAAFYIMFAYVAISFGAIIPCIVAHRVAVANARPCSELGARIVRLLAAHTAAVATEEPENRVAAIAAAVAASTGSKTQV